MEDAFAARAGCVGGSARQRGQPAEKQSYRRIKFLRCESQDPASQQDVRGGRSIRTRATNEPRIAHVQCGCSVQRTAYVQGRDRTGTAIVFFLFCGTRITTPCGGFSVAPLTGDWVDGLGSGVHMPFSVRCAYGVQRNGLQSAPTRQTLVRGMVRGTPPKIAWVCPKDSISQ